MRIMGLLVLIPASMLLTASFFVLFAVERVKENGMKTFGKVVAAILIIVSALLLIKGVYTIVTGRCPIMEEMQGMCCPMMKSSGMGKMGMGKGMCSMGGIRADMRRGMNETMGRGGVSCPPCPMNTGAESGMIKPSGEKEEIQLR